MRMVTITCIDKYCGKHASLRRRIVRNFSISLSSSVISLFLGVGRTAILTKALSIYDYGNVLIVMNLFVLARLVVGIRVGDTIFRFYPQFKKENNLPALRAFLVLAFLLCIFIGLFVNLGIFTFSNWIANNIYQEPKLRTLFGIYAIGSLFMCFEGFYSPILRISDKYHLLVIPGVIGDLFVFLSCLIYLYASVHLTLETVIVILSIGLCVQSIPPLIQAMRVSSALFGARQRLTSVSFQELKGYRSILISTFFQTSLVGYLKLAAANGGLFLLGIFSGPKEVALFGLARQLTKPLVMLQNNIQTALFPEIVTLKARNEFNKLHNLIRIFTKNTFLLGIPIVLLIIISAKPLILLISTSSYLESLYVFYLLVFMTFLSFGSLVFYPVALSLDQLKRRNFIVSIRFIYLLIAVFSEFNALTLALVLALGALTTRLFNDWPLYKRLEKIARKQNG